MGLGQPRHLGPNGAPPEELRLYYIMAVPKDFAERKKWPSVRSFGMAVREYSDKSTQCRRQQAAWNEKSLEIVLLGGEVRHD